MPDYNGRRFYSMQYQPPQVNELLPNFRRVPPPDVLAGQVQQTLNDMRVNRTWQPPYESLSQYQTLQGPIKTPPPNFLSAQARQTWRQDIQPLVNEYAPELGLNLMLSGSGLGLANGGRRLLASPQAQFAINSGVKTLEGTRYGRPVVNKARQIFNSAPVKKAADFLDFIF